MRRTRAKTGFILGAFALLLIFGFQNCFEKRFSSAQGSGTASSDNLAQPQGSGLSGGDGYDGKVYITLAAQTCADNSVVDSRLVITSGQPLFVRENCRDLSPAEIHPAPAAQLNDTTVVSSGKTFDLESVPATLPGQFTPGLAAGDYAPSLAVFKPGTASAVQAVPWGTDHVLVVSGSSTMPLSVQTLKAQLFQRSGMNLSLSSEATRDIEGIEMGFDYAPLRDLIPFGEDRAVLQAIVIDGVSGDYSLRLVLLKRDGEQVSILPTSVDLVMLNSAKMGGHPIDSDRYLLWYQRSDSTYAFRVLSAAGDTLTLGTELTGTSPAFASASAPAILPLAAPGQFRIVRPVTPAGATTPLLGSFTLTINGTDVVFNNDLSNVAGTDSGDQPFVVGNLDHGLLLYMTPDDLFGQAYNWGGLDVGVYTPGGQRSVLMDGSMMNTAGAPNLFIGGRYFFDMSYIGDHITYFETTTGPLKSYNLTLPGRLFWGGTQKVFGSGDKIVSTGLEGGQVVIRVMSTP